MKKCITCIMYPMKDIKNPTGYCSAVDKTKKDSDLACNYHGEKNFNTGGAVAVFSNDKVELYSKEEFKIKKAKEEHSKRREV